MICMLFMVLSINVQLIGQEKGRYHVKEVFDITYLKVDSIEMKLDLFLPEGIEKPVPVIVCVHGGAWHKGTRKNYHHVSRALAERGYATASVSYRLSDVAPFPAQIQDLQAAVVWLKEHADEYGIDRNRVGATGHSAGGHLVALLATAGNSKGLWEDLYTGSYDARVQASIPSAAQLDFQTERIKNISMTKDFYQKFLSGTQVENYNTYRIASPAAHLDVSDPPMAFMAGELDDPSTRAEPTRQRLDALGIANDFLIFENAPHNFLRAQEWFDESIDFMDQFFGDHLNK